MVSLDEVRHVAKLARMSLSDAEVERYAKELSAVLTYIDRLQRVDTSVVQEGAVFRDMLPPDRDLVRTQAETQEHLIQAFPDRLGNLLRVPSVFPRRSSSVS